MSPLKNCANLKRRARRNGATKKRDVSPKVTRASPAALSGRFVTACGMLYRLRGIVSAWETWNHRQQSQTRTWRQPSCRYARSEEYRASGRGLHKRAERSVGPRAYFYSPVHTRVRSFLIDYYRVKGHARTASLRFVTLSINSSIPCRRT